MSVGIILGSIILKENPHVYFSTMDLKAHLNTVAVTTMSGYQHA